MTILSVYLTIFIIALMIPNGLCEKADEEKRASLAYFKRNENLESEDLQSKRATLAYYKRSNPLVRRATLSYFKRAYNLCQCSDPYEFDSSAFGKQIDGDEWNPQYPDATQDKRASLAYFKKRIPAE